MTIPLYLNDTYLKEMDAMITEVAKESEPQQRWMAVLGNLMPAIALL